MLFIRLCRAVVRCLTMWLHGWRWDRGRGSWHKTVTVRDVSMERIAAVLGTVNGERWQAHSERQAIVSNVSWERRWADVDTWEFVVRYDIRYVGPPQAEWYGTSDFSEELP